MAEERDTWYMGPWVLLLAEMSRANLALGCTLSLWVAYFGWVNCLL